MMTLREYSYRMLAQQLAVVDRQAAMQSFAMIDREIQRTEKKGDKEVYIYHNENPLFKRDRAEDAILSPGGRRRLTRDEKRLHIQAEMAARLNAGLSPEGVTNE